MSTRSESNAGGNVNAEYAVYWYIRHHFELMTNDVLFPDSVKLLCSSFIGLLLNDEWEKKSDHSDRIIIYGEDNKWIKRDPGIYEWNTSICGKMCVDYSYIWKLQIGECNESQFGSLIGLIPNKNIMNGNKDFIALLSRFELSPYNGYSFWSYGGGTGTVQHKKDKKYGYGKKLYPDDVVEIHLNMQELTIEIVINGENQGIAHKDIVDTQYRLIVVLYNDDHLKLLNSA